MIDLRDLLAAIEASVQRHALGPPGAYARWLWQNDDGTRGLGVNEYGCADAANILYTIGRFPPPAQWGAWVEMLQARQDPQSGLFAEETHHTYHTTAHCVAALDLFGVRPRCQLRGLSQLKEPAALDAFLDGLDWTWNPWGESHKGAGVYAALVLAGEVGDDWQARYFDWMWREADPHTGLWRRRRIDPGGDAMLFHHLAGSFHYLFNHEDARRPLRYPAQLVETCLRIDRDNLFPPLGSAVGFAEVDWVYCLNRALRQCGHRFEECRRALTDLAERYVGYLLTLDPQTDDGFNDLHQLFGAVCALAELQQAVPGLLRSERPLRLVLDRRPFI